MNKCMFVGRVIAEPVFREAGGVPVGDIRLSVRTRGKDAQGYPNSIIIKCTIWRKLAEMARDWGLHKGQNIGVSGMLNMETYTAKDGTERTQLLLDVDDLDMIRSSSDMPVQTSASQPTQAAPMPVTTDEWPF